MFWLTRWSNGMRKKLRSNRGMTLTELIVALAIVSLIGVSLTVGVNGAAKVYRDATRLYEAETLCGTILTALEDELRFGTNFQPDETTNMLVTYESPVFGGGMCVNLDGDKIYIGSGDSNKLLSDKSYTSQLKVSKCDVKCTGTKTDPEGNKTVTKLEITVGVTDPYNTDDSTNYVEHTVTVAPVNS